MRAAIDAWNRGDWDAAFAQAAPDVVLDNSMVQGEYRGVHRGVPEAQEMFARFVEPWDSVRVEIEELVENGERVFTRMRGHFAGRDGIEVRSLTGACWIFSGDVITTILLPNDPNEAREAAGLPLS